jgi:predicted transcriptional regulator
MRTSSLVTISLPPKLVSASEKIARKQHMTRSELMRTALRQYLEWQMAEEAIGVFEKERREGKLNELKGSLVDLMR